MPTKQELINNGLELIPIEEIDIEYDKDKNKGYDFTVDDWFTFCTHDGVYVQDSMAIYIPINDSTIEEVKTKFIASNNLVNPANDSLSMGPGQDIVLGIYFLTCNKFENLNNKVIYKGKEITESRKIFNENLPDDYPLIDEPISKKELMLILDDIRKKYDKEITVSVLDNIKKIGFKYSTLYGSTLSLHLCEIEGLEKEKEELYKQDDIIGQLNRVNSEEIKTMLKNNFNYSYMIESGARGEWDQIKQVVFTRGFVSNFKGKILPKAIKNSLLNGLTQEEFFDSTYGCRKGLMDVAINTGTSGYLTRKLTMAMINLQVDVNLDDCGTTDTFNLYVKNDYDAKMLIHRYYINDNNELTKITNDNYKHIIGNTIKLRSPVFCKSHNLCKTCYGDLYKIIKTKFVGVISAQSLGETNTQMILRTFHTSTRNNTKILDVNGKSYKISEVYNIVKSGKDFYTFSCSPEGKIVVSKVIDAHKDRIEKQFVRVRLDNRKKVETTLDHEWIMRDGTHKQAKDLEIGDSIMPIYFSDSLSMYEGYRTIKQNNSLNGGRKELVFHLSSEHPDVKKSENLDKSKKIAKHHIDKNPNNDYPNNIMLLNEREHLQIHSKDGLESIDREKLKIIVSESNKRRTKNKEWVDKFNKKRNETLAITYPPEKNSEDKKKYFEENPEMKYHCTRQARYTTACIIIDKIKELGLSLNNINYNKIRKTFGDNGKGYVTFNYVLENHPELVSDFEIIEEIKKSKNQLNAEYRVNLILNKMKERDLELNEENFDKINEEIYPNPKSRWSRKALDKFSPGILNDIQNNHKITNIEFVELDEYEEFYDLTVDSEYCNFALGSGVFIHNSGVANIGQNGKSDSLLQQDIVADLSTTSKLLHGDAKNYNYDELITKLFDIYNHSRRIHYIHFECLVSQMMWGKNKKWRLLEDRDKVTPEYQSVQSIPTMESWLLGLSFSSPKKHILEGILYSDNYKGIIDDLLCGEKLY